MVLPLVLDDTYGHTQPPYSFSLVMILCVYIVLITLFPAMCSVCPYHVLFKIGDSYNNNFYGLHPLWSDFAHFLCGSWILGLEIWHVFQIQSASASTCLGMVPNLLQWRHQVDRAGPPNHAKSGFFSDFCSFFCCGGLILSMAVGHVFKS